MTFYVSSHSNFKADIYRMGGTGGELKGSVENIKANPLNRHIVKLANGQDVNWKPSFSITIPKDWKSGYYLVKLTNTSGQQTYSCFTVREEIPKAKYIILLSTNTYNAYNHYGGKSLYAYNSTHAIPATKVSFHRPYMDGNGSGHFFMYEYNLIHWMEQKGYDMTYITDKDVDAGILQKAQGKVLVVAGHGEYWTSNEHKNIQDATSKRMNIAVMGANVGYWQVRYEGSNMVGYKYFYKQDPMFKSAATRTLTTSHFVDKFVKKPSGPIFGSQYTGVTYPRYNPLVIGNTNSFLFTGVKVKPGTKIPNVVGGEFDTMAQKLPGNAQTILHSPVKLKGKKTKYYSDVVWYQKPSGAKSFAVGTFYWNWFLDPVGHESVAFKSPIIEQITENAFAELDK